MQTSTALTLSFAILLVTGFIVWYLTKPKGAPPSPPPGSTLTGSTLTAGNPAAGNPAAGNPAAGNPAAGNPAAGNPTSAATGEPPCASEGFTFKGTCPSGKIHKCPTKFPCQWEQIKTGTCDSTPACKNYYDNEFPPISSYPPNPSIGDCKGAIVWFMQNHGTDVKGGYEATMSSCWTPTAAN